MIRSYRATKVGRYLQVPYVSAYIIVVDTEKLRYKTLVKSIKTKEWLIYSARRKLKSMRLLNYEVREGHLVEIPNFLSTAPLERFDRNKHLGPRFGTVTTYRPPIVPTPKSARGLMKFLRGIWTADAGL